MFGKLLKYELKSQAKIILTIITGIIVSGIFITVLFNVDFRLTDGNIYQNRSGALEVFSIITTVSAMICIVVLSAAAVASIIILAHRFYKNLFSNEGYLTFTLPVSTNAQLMAKLISAIIWLILVFMALTVSVSVFFIFGTACGNEIYSNYVVSALAELISRIFDSAYIQITIETIILCLISLSFMLITIYFAITIGSIISKKHKLLASAGVYMVTNLITQIFQSIILFIGFNSYIDIYLYTDGAMTRYHYDKLYDTVSTVLISQCVLVTVLAVVCYITMKKLIDKKLNLP